jgi:glutathione peroxidase
MKTLLLMLLILGASFQWTVSQTSVYDFKVKTIDGEEFDFATLKGKKVMIVNTASKCGLTPQYEKLEALYRKYGSAGLVIVGFPANNFMGQEPGTALQIKEFCTLNYGVTFPMMEKISVKGNDMHPLYVWLTQKDKNGVLESEVKWNFQKYLIGKDGRLEKMFAPAVKPDDAEIVKWIEGE